MERGARRAPGQNFIIGWQGVRSDECESCYPYCYFPQ